MKEKLFIVFLVIAVCTAVVVAARGDEEKEWEITLGRRQLDLTTHQARQSLTLSLTNIGTRDLITFVFTVDSALAGNVAHIEAHEKTDGADPPVLPIASTVVGGKNDMIDIGGYEITLPAAVPPQGTKKITIELVFINSILPFPREITQNEKQLVHFIYNAYILSPYPIKSQSTIITLATATIESFSRVTPTSTSGNEITYGPYSDMEGYSHAKIAIHFENNGPFLTVTSLDRLIEVSHWGNIAVEEHVHVQHTGATLKGSYSRFDYQRIPNSGASSVKSYKTILPAAAADVYYRDEIGNISTSNLRIDEDYVELELRPRFPLFGGWQTRYYIGYNLPSYEYLYHSGSQFMLRMRLVDHVMDDQLVQDLTLRIVLPEGAKNVRFEAQYPVKEKPREMLQTYLDTVGRPVVVVTAKNLIEQHIQDFVLTYQFQTWMLLQEPLLVIVALYGFFLLIILIVRLDFSITKDVAKLARQKAHTILEKIYNAHLDRWDLIKVYGETITTFKEKKNKDEFVKTKKSLDDRYNKCTEEIGKLGKELQGVDSERGAKVNELQKKTSGVKAIVDHNCTLAEMLVTDRITSTDCQKKEGGNSSNMSRLEQEVNALARALQP